MSKQYPGGIISKTAPVPSGPYADSTASGIWTLEQQAALAKQGNWPTAGAVNPNLFIENLFSTYLYTGNEGAQTITNGIDLSTKGGMVWIKGRNSPSTPPHRIFDTVRGVSNGLSSNTTEAQGVTGSLSSFNSTGFGLNTNRFEVNEDGFSYASWTFREQSKFFDIVTYTGDGIIGRTVAHNLGSAPGCIIVKRTNTSGTNWRVYHRSLGATYSLALNTTAAATTLGGIWDNTEPTSTVFSVGDNSGVNASGDSYVAYLFAHDAGGFGLTGTDNVISCGSFTAPVQTTFNISLGYEPQFLLVKKTSGVGDWYLIDVMRGFNSFANAGPQNKVLSPNTSGSEGNEEYYRPTATGIQGWHLASADYIYIAIRRGPMAVPTLGTSVFGLNARTGTGAVATVTGGQTDDAVLIKNRGSAVASLFASRLTGTRYLVTSSTAADVAAGATILQDNPWDVMDGVKVGTTSTITNASANTFINYLFKRAPGFFDEVCYTGTGSATTVTHNLGVAPEFMIIKSRNTTQPWITYSLPTGNENYGILNTTVAWVSGGSFTWNNTFPTSTVFSLGASGALNGSGDTYVAYLFATCPGVSKVGSYTGNAGNTVTVPCGFTAGVRFVLIKRTDSTGDWYVWDSARGIVAGNDPYLLLNDAAAEVTGTDYVDTYAAGFEVTSTAPAGLNATGGSYIFLAIA